MSIGIKINDNKPEIIDKHIRSLNKESWDSINELRRLRKYSWRAFFDHLHKYKKDFTLFLSRDAGAKLCTEKSLQTVSILLPKWCDNIARNMPDILSSGDISCLVCKSKKNNTCLKTDKLREMVFDKIHEYELEDIAKECGIPDEYINYMLRQLYTYHFIPIAGSVMCIDCPNRVTYPKPALIIGGGPSLKHHDHLKLLKEHGFDGDIFVVSKSLKEVLDHGIIPKYVGALDAEEFDTTFFDHDIADKYSDQITGLFGITTHPTTQERWKGQRHYFSGYISEVETPNISHIFHLMTRTSNISVSGNIGSCMYNIASFLGYNPIVMIGMDLSFPTLENMKQYYPNSTEDDWKRKIKVGDKEVPMYKRGYNPELQKQYFMDSVYESYVISHKSWAKTLHAQGIRTINCTEQGALHSEYIENMRFEEYLKNQNNKEVK